MKILIIGAGKMGKYLAQILVKEKHNITVIDKNESVIDKINTTLDINTIVGNALLTNSLIECDIKNTDIVISTMKDDEDNILSSVIASSLGAKNTISRIRNPEYLKSINHIRDNLGISMIINPELLTAREISSALKYSDNIKSTLLSKGKIELIEFKLKENSPILNVSLKNLKNIIKSNIIVVAVERNDKVIVPNGDFKFENNDKLLITSTPKDISLFFKELKKDYLKIKEVMIIGGSKISYYLAKFLSVDKIKTKIIDIDINKCNELSENLENTLIINGDASDKSLLIEEGIENLDALVATTGIDEENVVYSMFANSVNVPKVITKINHLNFVEILENMGIENIYTPHVIATNHILRYIRAKENSIGGAMETLVRTMDDELEIMEFIVNKDFEDINKSLKKIKFKNGVIVVSIIRKNNIIFPTGEDIIEINDKIIIATTNKNIKGLNNILR